MTYNLTLSASEIVKLRLAVFTRYEFVRDALADDPCDQWHKEMADVQEAWRALDRAVEVRG